MINKNKKLFSLFVVSSLTIFSTAQAGYSCKTIGLTTTPPPLINPSIPDIYIQQTPCDFSTAASPIQILYNSGQYPSIFLSNPANYSSTNPPKLLQVAQGYGLCYQSVGVITAYIGSTAVNISTTSVWTNEFNPILLGGPDHLGAVITQWKVSLQKKPNTTIGSFYTHDTVNLDFGNELDVITSGTGNFFASNGAITLSSTPINATELKINALSGEICLIPELDIFH
jgi:hypothetical protein